MPKLKLEIGQIYMQIILIDYQNILSTQKHLQIGLVEHNLK